MASLQVNEKIPDFEMLDYKGDMVRLSDFIEKNNVLLVLNRGLAWPFCRKHMMQLHQDYNKFIEKNTIILVIGPDNSQNFNKFWKENDFKFFGIPDENHSLLSLYGQEVNLFKLGRMPGQILVDKKGIIRYVYYGKSMKDIPQNSEILGLIDSL